MQIVIGAGIVIALTAIALVVRMARSERTRRWVEKTREAQRRKYGEDE